jgi:hypothetical protein
MLTISNHNRNANQNHSKIPCHPCYFSHLKTPPPTGVGEDVGENEPSYTDGGNASYSNHSGKQYGGFLKIQT